MAAIRWSDVVNGAPAPDLASLHVEAQDLILATVEEEVNADNFGGSTSATYKRARVLLAAHYAQAGLDAQRGVAGPVTSMSADGLSKSFAVTGTAASSDDELAATGWGRQFKGLARSSAGRAGLVVFG